MYPRRIRESIPALPSLLWLARKFCQHFWVDPVVEVLVKLERVYLVVRVLIGGSPVAMHVIGSPLFRIGMAFRDQATVVPAFVDVLKTGAGVNISTSPATRVAESFFESRAKIFILTFFVQKYSYFDSPLGWSLDKGSVCGKAHSTVYLPNECSVVNKQIFLHKKYPIQYICPIWFLLFCSNCEQTNIFAQRI